jgi:hypothetical protein
MLGWQNYDLNFVMLALVQYSMNYAALTSLQKKVKLIGAM